VQAPAAARAAAAPRDEIPLAGRPSWTDVDDPRRDGWGSEVFAARAGEQLAVLGRLVAGREEATAAGLETVAAAECAVGELRPRAVRVVFTGRIVQVEREAGAPAGGAASVPAPDPAPPAERGPAALARALNRLGAPFRKSADARFEIKGVGVEAVTAGDGGAPVTTRHLAAFSGHVPEGHLETHALWIARWAPGSGEAAPRLVGFESRDFEETRRSTTQPFFADCAGSILARNPAWKEQFLQGLNHWLERIQDKRFFDLLGTPGLAAGDWNGDGLDDLYVCQEGGLPNRLFLQEADGTARDASEASGADWIESTRSALGLDLDGDGDQDLVAAVLGNVVVAENDGRARFTVRAILPTTQDTMSLCAADPDGDADLDLYVCAYKQDDLTQDAGVLTIGAAGDFVYHDANNGAPNLLFRNDIAPGGEWRFTDVTAEWGLDANNRRFSFAAAWEDFDNDGDQDLYVANDFGRSVLYRNDTVRGAGQPPRFTEIAGQAGADNSASGMSVSWGDFDRDGWMDVYIGNMFSAAGSRITYQPAFKAGAAGEVKTRLQHFARGSTLLRNLGGKSFADVSEEAAVTMGRWAWSSNFIDLENDGWEDLLVANGYVTTEDPGDL
jgi:hypothetical protein